MDSPYKERRYPYLPQEATCHVQDFSSEHEEVAAFVPEEGLIVYRDGHVYGWCDISDDSVERIAIFFTYQPFCKHYVLQLSSEVKVISHLAELKVTHVFEDVVKFEIGDFNQRGYPQLGLWKSKAKCPFITDLTLSCAPESTNPVEKVLQSKLKGLKASVDKVQHQLDEIKRLRGLCMFHILGLDCTDPIQIKKLVPFIGKSTTDENDLKVKVSKPTILVENSWQRLLHGKWILGCDVQNVGSSPLRSLSLCVSGPRAEPRHDDAKPRSASRPSRSSRAPGAFRAAPRASLGGDLAPGGDGVGVADGVEWRVMVHGATPAGDRRDRRDRRWPAWTTLAADGVLEPRQRASLVAMVPEPSFCQRSPWQDMVGMISAKLPDGRETWISVPRWRLRVDAVLDGSLLPFGPGVAAVQDHGHEDLLASLACSRVRLGLRLEGRVGLASRVARALADANLKQPDDVGVGAPPETPPDCSLLVGRGPSETPLHGALVKMDVLASTACTLQLYFREYRHVFLLVNRLLDGLPQHTRLSLIADVDGEETAGVDDDDSPQDVDELLRALLRAMEAELRAVAAKAPRRALHPLEMATDLAAQRLRVATAAPSWKAKPSTPFSPDS